MKKKLFPLFIALTLLAATSPALSCMDKKRSKDQNKQLCPQVIGSIWEFCPTVKCFCAMRLVNTVWKNGVEHHNCGTLVVKIPEDNAKKKLLLHFFIAIKNDPSNDIKKTSFFVELRFYHNPSMRGQEMATFLTTALNLSVLDLSSTDITGECFQYFPNTTSRHITKITFHSCRFLEDKYFEHFFPECIKLKIIFLSDTPITGECLNYLPDSARKTIEEIDLASCKSLEEKYLEHFFPTCTDLQFVELSGTPITGKCLLVIKKNPLKSIKEIDLGGCINLRDDYLKHFLSTHENLKKLTLGEMTITGKCLPHFPGSPRWKTLEEMCLYNCKISKEQSLKNFLSMCINLTTISFYNTSITGECFQNLPDSARKSLVYLDLDSCKSLEERSLNNLLPGCVHLKQIDLSNTPITGECLLYIPDSARKTIEKINLEFCLSLKENYLERFFPTCTHLKIISLSNTPITGECLLHIPDSAQKTIKYIYLDFCLSLKENYLKNLLAGCTHLKIISLANTSMTGECFQNLPDSARNIIEVINLEFCTLLEKHYIKNLCSTCINLNKLYLPDKAEAWELPQKFT